jgi:sugar lactone lactonase YvrE
LGPKSKNSRSDRILALHDFQGRLERELGEPFLLDTADHSWAANRLDTAVNQAGEIFAAFVHQNRIDKYSPEGKLLAVLERDLPFRLQYRYKTRMIEEGGRARPFETTDFSYVHEAIEIDGRGRLWALTQQKKRPSDSGEEISGLDLMALDVYGADGVWMTQLPLPREFKRCTAMAIRGDRVFFVDAFDQAAVFVYRIAERP